MQMAPLQQSPAEDSHSGRRFNHPVDAWTHNCIQPVLKKKKRCLLDNDTTSQSKDLKRHQQNIEEEGGESHSCEAPAETDFTKGVSEGKDDSTQLRIKPRDAGGILNDRIEMSAIRAELTT